MNRPALEVRAMGKSCCSGTEKRVRVRCLLTRHRLGTKNGKMFTTDHVLLITVHDILLFRPVRFFQLRRIPFLVPTPNGIGFLHRLSKYSKITSFSETIGSSAVFEGNKSRATHL